MIGEEAEPCVVAVEDGAQAGGRRLVDDAVQVGHGVGAARVPHHVAKVRHRARHQRLRPRNQKKLLLLSFPYSPDSLSFYPLLIIKNSSTFATNRISSRENIVSLSQTRIRDNLEGFW